MGQLTLRLWIDVVADLWVLEKAHKEAERKANRRR